MKKLIALVIAIVMMAALAVPAFAATVTAAGSSNTEVSYEPSASYTVTIPDSATIGSTATVSVSNAVLAANTQIKITVAPQAGDTWVLANGDETLNYTITKGNDQILKGGVVHTHAAGAADSSTELAFALEAGQNPKAMKYTQTITFTVAVEGTQA